MASSSQEGINDDLEVVEMDPRGHYVRYNKILGQGTAKIVYLGFDRINGIEIAWSKTQLTEKIFKNMKYLEMMCTEAHLLKSLKHENIVKCCDSWIDEHNKIIHMITELFTSGNLDQYLRKHDKLADIKTIKNWARQILKGLHYLHSRRPPIIHRDLKCDNIFVNGNTGSVKLGDFGLALIYVQGSSRQSYAGTPLFMAPELIEGNYNQLVDIYSFGLCILKMVTQDELYRKIVLGKKPVELSQVTDPETKKFIQKCLVRASERPAASDLLNDPFLAPSVSETSPASRSLSLSLREAVADYVATLLRRNFKLQGKMKDNVTISMTIWISFFSKVQKVKFIEFSIDTDTTPAVMEKMATDDGLSSGEITLVSELMDKLITAQKSPDNPWKTLEISSEQRDIRPFYK